MSALLKLLDVAPGADADTWIGAASGPAGKRSYGGQFVAQSLAAAYRTVDADRQPTNMHLQFLRGGEAGDPVEYTVARVFDGRTAAARRVDSHQDGRLLTTATVSFATELPGPEHGHVSDMPVIRQRCRGPGRPGPRRRCRWTSSTSGSPMTARLENSSGDCGGGRRSRCPTIRCCTRWWRSISPTST